MPQTESEKRTLEEDAWPSPPLERSKPTRSRETSAPCNLAAIEAAAAALSRAPMDPLAALLRERPPPQQLSATELRARIALLKAVTRACRAELGNRMHPLAALRRIGSRLRRWTRSSDPQLSASGLRSRIALLEDATRACCAELESRTSRLDALPDEIQQLIFGQLCNALDPRSAVAYSSASKGLREPMQRVGEGAGKSPLQQLQEENAAAAALCLKVGVQSCKALREATKIDWSTTGLSATGLATLGKLTPVLPALKTLYLSERSAPVCPDGGRLVEGLGVGALPALNIFELSFVSVGDAGASALAAALDRGALPRLQFLTLCKAAIGDAGLLALAPALRRRPALQHLALRCNPFGDEGLAALVAPPPADAPPPQAEVLAKLWKLDLGNTQITDAGCAHLASRLRSGALPALWALHLGGIPAGNAARAAVYEEARAGLRYLLVT